MDTRGIEIIDEFLALWKERALEHYNKVLAEMDRLHEEYSKTIPQSNRMYLLSEPERKVIKEIHDRTYKAYKDYQKEYKGITNDVHSWGTQYRAERLQKILDREVIAKKKTLIARISKKAGNILDAKGLYIGVNGEINGLVVGELRTVRVETIYAGGYNIQCLHYRVLIG